MGRRGWLVLAALLVVGLLVGYAGSYAVAPQPASEGVARPVEATPSIPADAIIIPVEDPDDPPLATGLELVRDTMGVGRTLTSYPRPKGWNQIVLNTNEVKYRQPGHGDNTFTLRVEDVGSDNRTIDSILRGTVSDVKYDSYSYATQGRTENSIEYTYISRTDRHFRHAFRIWLDLSGSGMAELEIAITGRAIDRPGMAELIQRIARGAHLVNG